MKRIIILVGLLLAMAHTTFAERHRVFTEFHIKSHPEENMEVNRSAMRLPIEVIYDSDTHKIEITGDESMLAEVFLYNSNGTLDNYSSSLNTEITVLTPGTYIIQIQGEGWYTEGKIEVY